MTRTIQQPFIVGAALALLVSVFSLPALGEIKIGVVNVQGAILASEEAKRLTAQIKEEFSDDEQAIVALQTEANTKIQQMQKDADVMSEAERRRVQQELESINNDFVYQRQKLQRQIDERQQELFAGIDQKVSRAIEDLVRDEDFDIIIPRQAAIYVSDVYDVTRKVTEKLNSYDR
ncbi:MAG: OmpH family outer membrane protein [Pseudomonadales bacterium]|nr:OmpH family outer membrane protein [Pseudomonadales bacterium]